MALLFGRPYEFSSGVDIVKFSLLFSIHAYFWSDYFTLIGFHSKPSDAVREVGLLRNVMDAAQAELDVTGTTEVLFHF